MSEPCKGGVLILVAGPSGAGKDTLIGYARDRLQRGGRYRFPRRFITRLDQTGEDHIPVSGADFEAMQADGKFFVSWGAHGLFYGIPIEILSDLRAGRHVIVNVSRRSIAEARRLWTRTEVIAITVDTTILRRRLQARGRESDAQIDERLLRAFDSACDIPGPCHTFDNSGLLDEMFAAFLALILHLTHQSVPADNLELPTADGLSQKR